MAVTLQRAPVQGSDLCMAPDLTSTAPSPPLPLQVLPVELLHGLTFALAWSTGTAVSGQLAPPGLEATTLSIFQGAAAWAGFCLLY